MADTILPHVTDLFRRLPPENAEKNLSLLVETLSEDVHDDILSAIDVPLSTRTDASGKEYIISEYNRDGESYRSPWTNAFEPPIEDAYLPDGETRKLEAALNEGFAVYQALYFESGVSSVYAWENEDASVSGVVLIKKTVDASSWDSIHSFEIATAGTKSTYKVISTVMLSMKSSDVTLSGNMTDESTTSVTLTSASPDAAVASHVAAIGKLVEEAENKIRGRLQEVYFSKTKAIASEVRTAQSASELNSLKAVQGELVNLLRKNSS